MSHTAADPAAAADERMRLVARLALARAALLEQLTGLPVDTLTSQPIFAGSSAVNILAHIASWGEFFAARLVEVAAGRGASIQSVDADERNAAIAAERRDWSLERSLAGLSASHAELFAAFDGIPLQALHIPIRVSWGQPTVARWLELCIAHDEEHTADLRAWRATLGEAAQETWHATGPGSLLAAALAARRAALLATMAFVAPQERETRLLVGPWTLKDLAGHIADWDLQGLVFIRAILAREAPPDEPDWELDRWNAQKAAARAGDPWSRAWGDFIAARQETLALLATLDDAALNTPFEGPLGGTPYQWFFMSVDHDRSHTEDLWRLVEPGPEQSDSHA